MRDFRERTASRETGLARRSVEENKVLVRENEEKLRRAFTLALNLQGSDAHEELRYATSSGWDSIAHMTLAAALEETFVIELKPEDIMEMSSYPRTREILSKYGIRF